jgi:hypothetical protein
MSRDQHPPESVVLVLQGTSPESHPGIVDGYERLRQQGQVSQLAVFPVFGPQGAERGKAFWEDVFEMARLQEASLVVFQYYHSPVLPDPRPAMKRLHNLPRRPLVVSTLGDAFMNGYFGRPSVPRSFLQAAESSDLVTLTSMGALADYVSGYTHAPMLLLANGACQVRFRSEPEPKAERDKEFDVAFVGSRNMSRNPLRPYHWFGKRRVALIEALSRRFGKRFAVFGNGWDKLPSSRGPVPFAEQATAVQAARVIVGGIPFSRARYYTSDRPFIQMTSGVPLVDVHVPGVEALLKDRSHWVLSGEERVLDTVAEVLSWPEEQRLDMGQRAASYVRERHMQAQRVATLVENVRRLRCWRDTGEQPQPHLPFFHDGADKSAEMLHATRNWPGVIRADK